MAEFFGVLFVVCFRADRARWVAGVDVGVGSGCGRGGWRVASLVVVSGRRGTVVEVEVGVG